MGVSKTVADKAAKEALMWSFVGMAKGNGDTVALEHDR